jgi:hypothetical protein
LKCCSKKWLYAISSPFPLALASASADGLARVWDHSGRLLGTLDSQPRFTAPRPAWDATLDEEFASARYSEVSAAPTARELAPKTAREAGDAFSSAMLEPAAHDAPFVYGPGRGTGYSFDRWSLTHVAAERLFDGRLVFVPREAAVAAPLAPPSHERCETDRARAQARLYVDPLAARDDVTAHDAALASRAAACPSLRILPPRFFLCNRRGRGKAVVLP